LLTAVFTESLLRRFFADASALDTHNNGFAELIDARVEADTSGWVRDCRKGAQVGASSETCRCKEGQDGLHSLVGTRDKAHVDFGGGVGGGTPPAIDCRQAAAAADQDICS